MNKINVYTSKIHSRDERVVLQEGDEALVERNALYLIKSFKAIGDTTLPFYRGVDLTNDHEAFVNAIKRGD